MSLTIQPKSENSSNEGLTFALRIIRDTALPKEERLAKSKEVLAFLKTRLEDINNARGLTIFITGGFIHMLREDDLWSELEDTGYQSWWQWGDFCKYALNMSLSKANALERIWKSSQKVQMEAEEIDRLGWAASSQILKVAKNRKEVEEWVDKFYECKNNEEFFEKVKIAKAARDNSGEEIVLIHKRVLKFSRDQAEFFDQAIELAAGRMGKIIGVGTSTPECLLFLMAQWRQFVQEK